MNKICSLCQTKSAASYASEFMSLANTLNLDNNAKLLQFQQGLSPELKKSLAISGVPLTTFETYMQWAIEIDQGTFLASRSERQSASKSSSSSNPPAPNHSQKNHAPSSTPPGNPKSSTSQPRGKITPEERKRRMDNKFCLYRADSEHFADHCLKKTKASGPKQTPTPRQTPAPTHSATVSIPVSGPATPSPKNA